MIHPRNCTDIIPTQFGDESKKNVVTLSKNRAIKTALVISDRVTTKSLFLFYDLLSVNDIDT